MPFYYIAAFAVLYFLRLRGRSRGWKRTLLAFVGGLVVAAIVGELLGRLLTLVLGSTGIDGPESLPLGLLSWGVSIVFGLVDILIAVAAITWLTRQPPVGAGVPSAVVPPGVDAGRLAPGIIGATGGAEATLTAVPSPSPQSQSQPLSPGQPVAAPGSAPLPLDATAAETLRLLVLGLSDPQPEVRRDCAAMMVDKFLPALEHEVDAGRRNAMVTTVRTLATDLRPPHDAAEHDHLFHAVRLYTLLTSPPADR